MHLPIEAGIFKPNLNKIETRNDITTRVAREINDGLEADRMAKTERLRAARKAREESEGPRIATKPPTRRRKSR